MTVRRAVVLAAVAVLGLFGLAGPAQSAPASYPPGAPILRIDKTLVRVGGTATATVSSCQPNSAATIVVTGPGRAPGSEPVTYPITLDGAGNATQVLTFTRLGRNTVTLTCLDINGYTVSSTLYVTVAAAPASGGGGVIGEVKPGTGADVEAGVSAADLAATGARIVGPLLLGAALLGAGAWLLLLSRRRRSA